MCSVDKPYWKEYTAQVCISLAEVRLWGKYLSWEGLPVLHSNTIQSKQTQYNT